MAKARIRDYLLGVEGLALIRSWLDGDGEASETRLREIASLVGGAEDPIGRIVLDLPDLDVESGYTAWAATYDEIANPLIRVEEPVVRSLIDRSPPGRALDAACGTGRHTRYLAERGHAVIGVDATAAMLEKARAKLPATDLRVGDLRALPVPAASVDLAVCGLALSHVEDIRPVAAELTRVLRPGGRLIVSDLHPVNLILGGGALFQAADGSYGMVRSYPRSHGHYIEAFNGSGLEIRQCLEPRWSEDEVALIAGDLLALLPEAFRAAMVGLPGALIWEVQRR